MKMSNRNHNNGITLATKFFHYFLIGGGGDKKSVNSPSANKRRAGVRVEPLEFTSSGGGVPPWAGSPAEQKVVF